MNRSSGTDQLVEDLGHALAQLCRKTDETGRLRFQPDQVRDFFLVMIATTGATDAARLPPSLRRRLEELQSRTERLPDSERAAAAAEILDVPADLVEAFSTLLVAQGQRQKERAARNGRRLIAAADTQHLEPAPIETRARRTAVSVRAGPTHSRRSTRPRTLV